MLLLLLPLSVPTAARWIGFRLDLLVSILMTVAPLLMMAVHERVRLPACLACSLFARLPAHPASASTPASMRPAEEVHVCNVASRARAAHLLAPPVFLPSVTAQHLGV